MGLREWLRPPRYTLPLFLAVTLGPAATVVWLGWRVLDLDGGLARQQVRDRLEAAANLIAGGLEHELDAIPDRIPELLASPDTALSRGGALVAEITPNGVEARAGIPLVYVPIVAHSADPPDSTWMPGEVYEFRDHDFAKAANAFDALARSSDPRIRAGALVRLARNLRKLNKPTEALEAYTALGVLDVRVGEAPAALVAREARCRLLHDVGRLEESRAEAAAMSADLAQGRWPLDRTTFLFHEQQADTCAGGAPKVQPEGVAESLALAAAVDMLWRDWRATGGLNDRSRGRRSVWIDDRAVLLVWRAKPDRLLAFAAGSGYVTNAWQRLWVDQRASVTLIDGDGHRVLGGPVSSSEPEAARMVTETRLPWTLRIASAEPDREFKDIARRRELYLASLGLIAFLVLTGSYFVARAIQKELAMARLQADFVSAVSHEFRTPLTSMRHLTELLKTGQVSSAERRQQYYDVLASEAERLHRFVETLLNFGRMDAGAEQYRFDREEPATLVAQIVDEFQAAPGGRRRRITVSPNGGLPPVWIDREAFGRALWNLLDNAAKYSPDEAPIDVALNSEGDRLAISVQDQGPGIPAAEQARIFQKFVRGSASRESGVKGTGVGLAIVQHVVRAHGGDVRVRSDVGHGSTFTMSIPTAERHT